MAARTAIVEHRSWAVGADAGLRDRSRAQHPHSARREHNGTAIERCLVEQPSAAPLIGTGRQHLAQVPQLRLHSTDDCDRGNTRTVQRHTPSAFQPLGNYRGVHLNARVYCSERGIW